jgi:DUF4097 and DUF4098 domain-containing protein YvlB
MRFFTFFIALFLIGTTFSSMAGDSIDKNLAIDKATNVRIEILRGSITLSANDENQVSVKGELDDDAERFIFEREGSNITIRVLTPRNIDQDTSDKGSNLVINIPRQLKVKFSGVSANVLLNGFSRSVEVKTVSGNINASALSSFVELTSVSGKVTTQNLSGKIRLSTVSGDINDDDSSGRLNLKAVSGNVSTRSSAEEVTVSTVSGDVAVELLGVDELFISTISGNYQGNLALKDNGSVKMSSISGNLDTFFNKPVQAHFKLAANAGGNLVNELTSDKVTTEKYGKNSKLRFSTGNGSGSVKATTVSGHIKVAGNN